MEEDAYIFLKENLPSWKDVSNESITSEQLPFSNSRKVYKVSVNDPQIQPDVVLLRQWTQYSGLTSRDKVKEAYVFRKLADLNLAAKLFGQNEKYRIEEYKKNSRAIKNTEINMPTVRRKLAISLAKLHSTQDLVKPEMVGENHILDLLENKTFMNQAIENCKKCLNGSDDASFNEILNLFGNEGLEFIKKIVKSEEWTSSHNDIWCGNILAQFDDSNDSEIPENILFVDYETFGFNFPGYDIGKLLAENMYDFKPCGHEYELRHDLYPNEKDIYDFLRFYILSFDNHPLTATEDSIKKIITSNNEEIDEILKSFYGSEERVNEKLASWWIKSRKGAIVSAYYCILLGFWIGKNDNYKTDFIKFGLDGYSIFNRFKNENINL